MSLYSDEVEFTSKDTLTCEECGHVNITKIKKISARSKRGHMVYVDDVTWTRIKTAAAGFGQPIGEFLQFLIKIYENHKENFNVV